MTEAIDVPTTSPPVTSGGYHPALDGVRGIAIALVVLFHYPWGARDPRNPIAGNPVHGGFLGVDAFFVLSGFLITTLLLREHARFGCVSFRGFYARRALRLLPALAILLLIALVLHFALAPGNPNRPETTGLLGVVFYVANWVNIYRPHALGITSDTWSLAIEEQFYLLWPLALVFLLHRRLRIGTIAIVAVTGIAGAAAWRAWYWYQRFGGHVDIFTAYARGMHRTQVWNRLYFGSDTRIDTLLAGSLTAILLFWLLPRLSSRHRNGLGVAAVVAFAVGALIVTQASVIMSGWMPEWGFLAFEICIAVLIAGLVARPQGMFTRAFAVVPLVWIGRRSYAIYLFHQLVFVYLARTRIHLSPESSLAMQLALILLLADLSYRVVEAPMLRRKRRFEPGRRSGTLASDA
jgi:peptidoglycan/LPS O-acetylase OafA/YrhL